MNQLQNRGAAMTGWLRIPPSRLARPELRALFMRVAENKRFQRVAGLSALQIEALQGQIGSAAICDSNLFQGGFAGRPPNRGLVMGLSRLHRRVAPAAHELFHLARDIRGVKRLNDETHVWREECIVWFLTWQFAPIRTVLELTALFGILMTGVYAVLQAFYWLLGLGSVADYWRQLFR